MQPVPLLAFSYSKPVSFRYTQEIDPKGLPQFGLVAEEVEKVHPDLVTRDRTGHAYTVRYEAVNAMLLNEFLKEHRRVEAQEVKIAQQDETFRETVTKLEAIIEQQQREIRSLTADLKQQASQIQQVNAQLQLDKPEPRIVRSTW
jgi:translation initiation factor 1 (eIF-1/SUI1)